MKKCTCNSKRPKGRPIVEKIGESVVYTESNMPDLDDKKWTAFKIPDSDFTPGVEFVLKEKP